MTPATLAECDLALRDRIAECKEQARTALDPNAISHWTEQLRNAEVALAEVRREQAK